VSAPVSATIVQVIAAIEDNRQRFEEFCYSLSEEQLNRAVPQSTWVVRDFAAHLATLDRMLSRMFTAAIDGNADSSRVDGEPFDVDAFNDAAVAERRNWPLERVFAEAADDRRALVEVLSQLTDEQIDRTMHFGADAKRKAGDLPLKLFLAGWAQHDPIHAADMLKALPELADDTALRAWTDNPFVHGYQRVMNAPPTH
jgi:hypothetical protein